MAVSDAVTTPSIPDHTVLTRIGSGSYGEVWLGRNVIGAYRAIKVVYRRSFEDVRPYDREFEGVRLFEPISRTHPNLVAVLQIGRNELEGFFYYVMESADDVERGQVIDPDHYAPHTLALELQRRGRIPLPECCQLGQGLAAGLGHLHHRGLIHRDVKPSNIVFVDHVPKFADVGLVTPLGCAATSVNTPGYAPVEGGGLAGADLYGLGKVLYEAFTGKDRQAFPELPTEWRDETDLAPLKRFNDLLLKACHANPRLRFQSAREMFEALNGVLDKPEAGPRVLRKWFTFLWPRSAPAPPLEQPRLALECPSGAVPLDSPFYIARPADTDFQSAVSRGDSIILVSGARQMGKTSLLARGLQQARQGSGRVMVTDFQEMNVADLTSLQPFYLALGELLATQLNLPTSLADSWEPRRGPNLNFERFLRRSVLEAAPTHVFWGMDEVDRLFFTPFGNEVFAMLRAWHNRRALDPEGPWSRLTVSLAYATEAHRFISDPNQSPFNVGTLIPLEDFSLDQVAELNRRYGSPLRTHDEIVRFRQVFGGQPYLARRGLYEMVEHAWDLSRLEAQCQRDTGCFGDHLRALLRSLQEDPLGPRVIRQVLAGAPCPDPESFYRLRSMGLLRGESLAEARPRCALYARYLQEHLR